jgi:hypothetical protein
MLRRNVCLLQQIISEGTRTFEKGKSFTIKSLAANKVPNRIALSNTFLHFFTKKVGFLTPLLKKGRPVLNMLK